MSQKSSLVPKGAGGIWFGDQSTLDMASAIQVKMDGMSLLDQMEMRTQATELQARMTSTEEQYAEHYMIDVYGDSLAVVHIEGSLLNHPLPLRAFGMNVTTYGEIQQAVHQLARDANITDVMFQVSSGGGSGTGMYATSNLVARLGDTRKLHTFANSSMGSAAYYLGVNSPRIYSDKMAMVGSIGVYMTMVSRAKALENEGMDVRVVRAGEFKALGNTSEPISDKALAEWQKIVDTSYIDFLEHTSAKRGINQETFRRQAAEGREFFGPEAVQVGLVDEVLSFDETVEKILNAQAGKTSILTPRSGGNQTGSRLQSSKGVDMNETMRKLLEAAGIELSTEQETLLATGTEFFDLGLNLSADLKAQLEAAAAEGDEAAAGEEGEAEGEGEGEGETAAEGEATGEGEVKASSATATGEFTQMLDRITEMSSKLVESNTVNAQLLSKVTEMEALLEGAKAELSALRPIAEERMKHMHVALRMGEPNLSALSVVDLAAQHSELKLKFEKVFPTGRKTAAPVTAPQPGRTVAPAEFLAAAQKATQL